MIKIILSTFFLLLFAQIIQAQTLTQAEKITEKNKVDLNALIEEEAKQITQPIIDLSTNAILPFPKKNTIVEDLIYWQNHKLNIEKYISDLSLENNTGALTPMIKKYEKALQECEAKIVQLSALPKE